MTKLIIQILEKMRVLQNNLLEYIENKTENDIKDCFQEISDNNKIMIIILFWSFI